MVFRVLLSIMAKRILRAATDLPYGIAITDNVSPTASGVPIRSPLSRLFTVILDGLKALLYTCIRLLALSNSKSVSFLAHHLFQTYTLSVCANAPQPNSSNPAANTHFI